MALGALALSTAVGGGSAAAQSLTLQPVPPPNISRVADWAVRSGDNQNMPFAVIDKDAALVAVFDADGRLLGAEAALVGSARGDDSVPGIGDRQLSDIRPEERTTPAGRFVGFYGPAAGHKDDVLWVDFEAAVSLHPVVTSNREEKRLQRLRSPAPDDNRITYGCINVSQEFYETVVSRQFKGTKGVFYVLPDSRPVDEVFPDLGIVQAKAAPPQPKSRFRWLAGTALLGGRSAR